MTQYPSSRNKDAGGLELHDGRSEHALFEYELLRSLERNWPLYVFEASELAIFMLSACAFTVFLFDPSYPALHLLPSAILRRTLMGIAMGVTATLIIHSPMGKRSGAHFNPAITLTYFRLRKISTSDAVLYVLFQFIGGILGVAVAAIFFWQHTRQAVGRVCGYSAWPVWNGSGILRGTFHGRPAHGSRPMDDQPAVAGYVYQLLRWSSDRALHPVLCSRFRLQHQSSPHHGIGGVRGRLDIRWLYFAAPVLGMPVSAEIYLRSYGLGSNIVRKITSRSGVSVPVYLRFPGHRHAPEGHPEP